MLRCIAKNSEEYERVYQKFKSQDELLLWDGHNGQKEGAKTSRGLSSSYLNNGWKLIGKTTCPVSGYTEYYVERI